MPALGSISSATSIPTDAISAAGSTMTGPLTLPGAPTSGLHAATKDYVDAASTGSLSDWKEAVRAASTQNVTLATGVENGDTLDGVVLATGDHILLKNQTAGAENGIYTVAASGAPTRRADADGAGDFVQGTVVLVSSGTANAGTTWFITTTGTITIGTTATTWVQTSTGATITDGSITPAKIAQPTSTKTANYTATSADKFVRGTGTWTLTINSSSARELFVKNAGTGVITITATSGTIDTAASITIGAGEAVHLASSDGLTWDLY